MILKDKNIVVIGGGTGTYTVLTGLKKYIVSLTAIVSMADEGGSTKILREEFGILPPGSVRPALVALARAPQTLAELFNFRFKRGRGLSGHNFGNLFLTALTEQFGSFEKALEEAGKILRIQGQVIPSTLQRVHLVAELENGKIVRGEGNIDIPKHDGHLEIQRVWLEPKAKANPKAIFAIKNADLIVMGPGDLYSSIIPNFLVQGIKEAIQNSPAKKVYVCNIMTKFGETTGFSAKDFLDVVEKYIGKEVIDYIFLNKTKPSAVRIKRYEREKAEFVKWNLKDFKERKVKVIVKDFLRKTGFIRHDPDKLAKALINLL